MKLLAVETATPACSVALLIDDEIIERFQMAPREHTKLILPMAESLLQEAGIGVSQLDAVAFGRGPGSFTGVRIATGVAQGIALGADIPVAPVSTLASIAQHYFNQQAEDLAFTAMDARMGEIFWGVYRKNAQGLAQLMGKEAVTPAERIEFPDVKGAGIGSGWEVYARPLAERLGGRVNRIVPEIWPHAVTIVQLAAEDARQGHLVPVEHAMPVYLRDKVAKKESER